MASRVRGYLWGLHRNEEARRDTSGMQGGITVTHSDWMVGEGETGRKAIKMELGGCEGDMYPITYS